MHQTKTGFSLIFLFLGLLAPIFSLAQTTADTLPKKSYLFAHFMDGGVQMKNGHIEAALLNFDTDDQSIVFKQDGKTMVLTGLETVDTVFITDKKFIPVGTLFYEAISGDKKLGLCASYFNKTRPLKANTDKAGTQKEEENKVSNNMADIYLTRPYKGEYMVEIHKRYFIRIWNDLFKAGNEKQFANAFPSAQADKIRGYIDTNNINFRNEEDLARLLNYCRTLGGG